MAHAATLANVAANAAADAVCALLNSGYLRVYDGTRPATTDTALSGNTLLAEFRFAATAFGAASAGVATANAIDPETSAPASGTATFGRLFKTDGTTAVMDGEVGTSSSDINISSTTITAGDVLSASMTYTQSKST
jgi:hypothetical protein